MGRLTIRVRPVLPPRSSFGSMYTGEAMRVRGSGRLFLAATAVRLVVFLIDRTAGAPPEERILDFVYFPLVEADGATPLLDAGEAAGVLMPSGCRMGICFSCVLPLRALSVAIPAARSSRTYSLVTPTARIPVSWRRVISGKSARSSRAYKGPGRLERRS